VQRAVPAPQGSCDSAAVVCRPAYAVAMVSTDEMLAGWRAREALRQARARQRAESLRQQLPAAKRLLLGMGAQRVTLFGSLARGDGHEASDVDLAVAGLPADAYFRAMSELNGLFGSPVDLVEWETAGESLRARIEQEGVVL
jgi:predicted nucleotidyltransferase